MLTSSPRRRLWLALLAICGSALLCGSLATGEARANDCAVNNLWQMGVSNTCNGITYLSGTAPTELSVSTSASGGTAVSGWATSLIGATKGVYGSTNSTSANASGVTGIVNVGTTGSYSAGVAGFNNGTNFGGFGVYGRHAGQGIGVYGEAENGFAVSGFSPNNWSGYFQGSVSVVGTLYKSSGAFRIDNPIDPEHSYLQHSFVESPQMTNIYKGHVTTNGKGFATVKLPSWFGALNKDFEYQLTILGHAPWGTEARVWDEIAHNRFTIRTSKPNVKVSWQMTGVRQDRYANAHRIRAVVPKEDTADGRYLHPDLYGKPLSKSVVVLPGMRPRSR